MTDKSAAQPLQWPEIGDRPADTKHRTRRADIQVALEAGAQPRNLVAIARVSQDLKEIMRHTPEWKLLGADQREALERIQEDVALILN